MEQCCGYLYFGIAIPTFHLWRFNMNNMSKNNYTLKGTNIITTSRQVVSKNCMELESDITK
jgi:hypothetical protein